MHKISRNLIFYVFITLISGLILYLFFSAQSTQTNQNQKPNPTSVVNEQFAQVNDSENRNSVSQVAVALEAYLNQNGSYTGADSTSLVSDGYLKKFPTSTTVIVETSSNPGKSAIIYAPLNSNKYSCPTGQTGTKRWVWRTTKQDASVECSENLPIIN